jgi:hypothetical protein
VIELPEDGSVVPTHIELIRLYYGVFSWFSKIKQVVEMQGINNFKIIFLGSHKFFFSKHGTAIQPSGHTITNKQ